MLLVSIIFLIVKLVLDKIEKIHHMGARVRMDFLKMDKMWIVYLVNLSVYNVQEINLIVLVVREIIELI